MSIATRLKNNRFVKNVLIMASGTISGQLVLMLALPILTRLYDPSAFGLLGIYMSLVAFLVVMICARLEIAIPIPENDADAINLLALSLISATLISLFLAITFLTFPEQLSRKLGQPDFRPFLWMVPFGVWLGGLYAGVQMWSVRRKRFSDVAKTQFVRACGSSGAQIGIGVVTPSPFGLVFGHFLYTGLGSFRLAYLLWRHDRDMLIYVSRDQMWRNLSEQRRFPIYSMPESILNSASVNLPILLIGSISGPAEAGFMLLAQRIGSVPVGLLGSNISRVYLAQAMENRLSGKLGSFTRVIMWTLFKLGIGPFLILGLTAPFLFPIVFGEEWDRAGIMVACLVPAMFMQFIVSPVSTILHATNNQLRAFLLQLSGFVIIIGGIVLTTQIYPKWIFEIFAAASLLHYGIYFAVVFQITLTERG